MDNDLYNFWATTSMLGDIINDFTGKAKECVKIKNTNTLMSLSSNLN